MHGRRLRVSPVGGQVHCTLDRFLRLDRELVESKCHWIPFLSLTLGAHVPCACAPAPCSLGHPTITAGTTSMPTALSTYSSSCLTSNSASIVSSAAAAAAAGSPSEGCSADACCAS